MDINKIEMNQNNIFTFDLDDDQQFNQIPNNIYNHKEQQHSNATFDQSHSQRINRKFVNQELRQVQLKSEIQPSENQLPLKEIKNNEINNNESRKRKYEESKQQISKDYERKQNFQSQTIVTKSGKEIVTGLQVEDLGTNEMQYVNEKKALRVTDMRKFLITPLGEYKIKAVIKRQKGGLFNLNNRYNVYIEQNNKYLFSIIKDGLSTYLFSLGKNSSQKKKNYLGKMVGNISGTQFLLFDNGFSPKQTRSLQHCRKQLASIKYCSSSGPRKFTTIISTNCQGFYSLESEQNILEEKWEKKQRDYLAILHSKAPYFDPEDGNYKLDFKGLVKKASVKNFILGRVEEEESLIFGKTDDDNFIMEIKEPLSVFQAAAVCVSSIHYKFYWK